MSDRKELFWDEERQQQYWIEWIETGNNDIPMKHYISNKSGQIEPPVKPEIADIIKITMWVDMIWNDIFDDDELDFNPRQMNIIGKYINDAKERIRKQFSV